MTIKKRALAYARRYPGQSATQIANALRAKPGTVSSILYLAVREGALTRTPKAWIGFTHWHAKGGGGPAGGYVYGPALP